MLGWRCGTSSMGRLEWLSPSVLIRPLQLLLHSTNTPGCLFVRPPAQSGVQGAGAQLWVSRGSGEPCVSLAESGEVRKRCLLLARPPGEQQACRPVPAAGMGFSSCRGWMPVVRWGQTQPRVTVQCALLVRPRNGCV